MDGKLQTLKPHDRHSVLFLEKVHHFQTTTLVGKRGIINTKMLHALLSK
jgi:hypothetical protein